MNIVARIPTTLSSREFNQNTSAAKKAAEKGPVFITDRGKPAHVLLSIEQYRRLTAKSMSLAEALEQKDAPDFDFEFPRMGDIMREPDLS
jgi:prevent-host-death family protein